MCVSENKAWTVDNPFYRLTRYYIYLKSDIDSRNKLAILGTAIKHAARGRAGDGVWEGSKWYGIHDMDFQLLGAPEAAKTILSYYFTDVSRLSEKVLYVYNLYSVIILL